MDQSEIERRLQTAVGRLFIQNELLQLENEKLKVQVAATSVPEPEPPKDPA